MLKIKDNVDLKELEKYGFKFIKATSPNEYYLKKVYLGNDNDDRIFYYVELYGDRTIKISRFDGEDLDNTLYDLIKADLVEKIN